MKAVEPNLGRSPLCLKTEKGFVGNQKGFSIAVVWCLATLPCGPPAPPYATTTGLLFVLYFVLEIKQVAKASL